MPRARIPAPPHDAELRRTRLFPDRGSGRALELVSNRTTGAGVTIGTYRPAGELRTGSFLLDS